MPPIIGVVLDVPFAFELLKVQLQVSLQDHFPVVFQTLAFFTIRFDQRSSIGVKGQMAQLDW